MRSAWPLVFVVACRSDTTACDRLAAECPAPGNRQACLDTLEEMRLGGRDDDASTIERCLEENVGKGCPAAAACLSGDGVGWTHHEPLRALP